MMEEDGSVIVIYQIWKSKLFMFLPSRYLNSRRRVSSKEQEACRARNKKGVEQGTRRVSSKEQEGCRARIKKGVEQGTRRVLNKEQEGCRARNKKGVEQGPKGPVSVESWTKTRSESKTSPAGTFWSISTAPVPNTPAFEMLIFVDMWALKYVWPRQYHSAFVSQNTPLTKKTELQWQLKASGPCSCPICDSNRKRLLT